MGNHHLKMIRTDIIGSPVMAFPFVLCVDVDKIAVSFRCLLMPGKVLSRIHRLGMLDIVSIPGILIRISLIFSRSTLRFNCLFSSRNTRLKERYSRL